MPGKEEKLSQNNGKNEINKKTPEKLFEGYGGEQCSTQDILVATNAVNNLDEKHGVGAQIINGFRKDIKWGCAAGEIKGPVKQEQSTPIQQKQVQREAAQSSVDTIKQEQKAAAQKIVTESYARDKAINGFKPNIPSTIPLAQHNAQVTPYRPYSYNNYNNPRPMFIPYNYAHEARVQLLSSNLSFTERMRVERAIDNACSFANFQMSCGYSYLSGLGSFSNALSMTGLISSYNSYNVSSIVREAIHSSGEIGGVASEVSLMTDLIDSEAHAKASEYFFCFPKSQFTFSASLINRIEKELAEAYFNHRTLPFFSLHFNNDGFLYPVLHPAFEGTLVGEIIALLDYWMKGFLNGGIFDKDFLKLWQETTNCDENQLRSKLIDLKKDCKEHAKKVDYISLRELESRYGLKSKGTSSQYKQPYMTSFRIIAYEEEVRRHGNVLIPKPSFKVEYSIDIMPDYKEYLEKYHQEHGDYPKDYENTKRCYELYAEEIKTKMPQLPLFKDYFQLLGIINAFCYANATFEKMGKVPVIDEASEHKAYTTPKAFPPLPVRYFRTYPVSMSLKQLLATDALQKEIDVSASKLFSNKNTRSIPEQIVRELNREITAFIQKELTKSLNPNEVFESNEEEIARISHHAERVIYSQIRQTHRAFNKALQEMVKILNEKEQQRIKNLPLPEKITAVQNALEQHIALYNTQWKTAVHLPQEQILQAFPPELQERVRTNLQEIKEATTKEVSALTLVCKQQAGMLSRQEQAINPPEVSATLQKEIESIREQFHNLESAIETNFLNSTQKVLAQQTQLNQTKESLDKNILLAGQEIQKLQQHRATQLAKIPAHLHAVNAANIAAFVTPLDNEVARLTLAKTEIESMQKLVDNDLLAIKAALAEAPQKKVTVLAKAKNEMADELIANIQKAAVEGEERASKAEATRVLDLFQEHSLKQLKHFSTIITQFSSTLLAVPELADTALTQHYTHAIICFSSQELAQKIGDNHHIVGGCGLAVPNLQTKPIEHGEEFCDALAKAMSEQQEQVISFSFNGQEYAAYSLAVEDLKKGNAQKPSASHRAQSTLLGLMKDEIEVETLSKELCQERLDPANASMMHYAAAALDAARFNKLPGDSSGVRDKLGNIPLHFAAQSGNAETVSAILSKNPLCVNTKNNNGLTPLILAIQNNHLDVVKRLLSFTADGNYRLPNGLFPLYIALQNNFTDIALYLLDNLPGLNINEILDSKMSALHLSIEADALAVALKLIEKGALCTVTRKSDGFTPLFCAVKRGHVSLIKAMQAKGVPLNTLLESGKSLLHTAAESGQLECLRYLIGQGLNPDAVTSNGETALMLAIKAGHLEAAKYLAEKTKLDQVNNHKQTASQLAIKYAMPAVSDILIERGENPALVDDKGYNYIYYLVRNGEVQRFTTLLAANKVNLQETYPVIPPKNENLLKSALRHFLIPEELPYIEGNLLEIAAKYKQFLLVFPLIEKLEKLSFLDKSGFSLLEYAVIADEIGFVRRNAKHSFPKLVHLAAQYGSILCLDWLLKKGELSKQELLGSLKKALKNSTNPKTIELLVQRLDDVNQALDTKGNTALHLATLSGSRAAIELLLSVGCDIRIRNKDGHTAFHSAVTQEDDWLLKRLFKMTQPHEWPADLWRPSAMKPTAEVTKILEVYRKRLPKEARLNAALQEDKQDRTELPTLKMTEKLANSITKIEAFFEDCNYEEAIEYLQENPDMFVVFESQQGAHLLKTLFENIQDHRQLLAALEKDKAENLALELSPDNLLDLLKSKGVNPSLLTGENNVLLGLLRLKSDKEALYRLEVFAKYFPDSVALLALDKVSNKMRVVELALKLNKVALFKALLNPCIQANSLNLYGLHEAVLANNYELVKDLLNNYAVDGLNQQKQTPLMLAAGLDNVRIMELLLAHGANPDTVDKQGKNALHYALLHEAESTALSILPLLKLKNQPDRYGITPLMLAGSKGIMPAVRYLCEQGDYSESFDKKGWNALHYAALEGQIESARYLESQGFDPNEMERNESPKNPQRTPLHLAALKGHTEMVKTLKGLGAKMDQEDVNHQSVYEYGVKSKSIDLLHYLEEQEIYSKNRNTKLLLAACEVDNEEVVSQLILDDVNCNATDESGYTALHVAAIRNAGKVASLILQGGDAAVDITDQRMCTPLYYAAQLGHVWLIELLCEAGAQIDYHNSTTPTALFVACEQGNIGAVAALLKFNPDFTIPNKEGTTAMEIARMHGHQEICKLLAAAKTDQQKPQKQSSGVSVRNGFYRQSAAKLEQIIVKTLTHSQ